MNPKMRRDRLFKGGRPFIRPIQLYDGGNYHKDVGILWLAYKEKPFIWMAPGLNQRDFAESLKENELLAIEDKNAKFKSGSGIVTVVCQFTDGWKLEPHASHMPWASPRNKLRSAVSYLQYVRYSRIGVCIVYTVKTNETFFNKCCEYGVIHRVGVIVNGDPKGDVVVYSIRGKKHGIDISGSRPEKNKDRHNANHQTILYQHGLQHDQRDFDQSRPVHPQTSG